MTALERTALWVATAALAALAMSAALHRIEHNEFRRELQREDAERKLKDRELELRIERLEKQ